MANDGGRPAQSPAPDHSSQPQSVNVLQRVTDEVERLEPIEPFAQAIENIQGKIGEVERLLNENMQRDHGKKDQTRKHAEAAMKIGNHIISTITALSDISKKEQPGEAEFFQGLEAVCGLGSTLTMLSSSALCPPLAVIFSVFAALAGKLAAERRGPSLEKVLTAKIDAALAKVQFQDLRVSAQVALEEIKSTMCMVQHFSQAILSHHEQGVLAGLVATFTGLEAWVRLKLHIEDDYKYAESYEVALRGVHSLRLLCAVAAQKSLMLTLLREECRKYPDLERMQGIAGIFLDDQLAVDDRFLQQLLQFRTRTSFFCYVLFEQQPQEVNEYLTTLGQSQLISAGHFREKHEDDFCEQLRDHLGIPKSPPAYTEVDWFHDHLYSCNDMP